MLSELSEELGRAGAKAREEADAYLTKFNVALKQGDAKARLWGLKASFSQGRWAGLVDAREAIITKREIEGMWALREMELGR